MITEILSIAGARRELARTFRQDGLDTPELDARVLVAHTLGLDRTQITVQAERALTAWEANAIEMVATRRRAHEPVARILGEKEFWGLALKLNAETLVPRPETETIVEAALAAIPDRRRPLRIADLGTGSGALLLALLSELPQAWGVGTDVSRVALACARDNASALGVAERARFVACDYASALKGPFDIIVSNPPYIAHSEMTSLQPEVRLFDPLRALDGGSDGLNGYRAIAAEAPRVLAPDGVLVVEVGAGQRDAVMALFADGGLATAATKNDLSGIPRALTIRLAP